jgi:hypothetical protein
VTYAFGRDLGWRTEDIDRLTLAELNDYIRLHNEEIRTAEDALKRA